MLVLQVKYLAGPRVYFWCTFLMVTDGPYVYPLPDHSGTMRLAADYPVMALQVGTASFAVLSICIQNTDGKMAQYEF